MALFRAFSYLHYYCLQFSQIFVKIIIFNKKCEKMLETVGTAVFFYVILRVPGEMSGLTEIQMDDGTVFLPHHLFALCMPVQHSTSKATQAHFNRHQCHNAF